MSLSEDKIHKPSSKRLRNAAENGQFPYSSDLAVALALLTGCILVSLNAQNLTDKFVGFYREFYSASFAALTDVQTVMNDLPMLILGFVAPLALTVWFISLLVSWIQSPKVARKNAFSDPSANWNPVNRWEQMVSVTTPLRLLFQLVRMAAVVGVAWYGLQQLVAVTGNAAAGSPQVTASEVFAIYPGVLIQICMVILAFAVIDRLWQQKMWWDSVHMTPEELKKERRETHGDPLIRKKRKQSHRKLISALSGSLPASMRTDEGKSQ